MKLYFRKSLIRNIIQYPICVFLIAILFNSCKKEEVKYLSLNPSLLNITYENGQSKVNDATSYRVYFSTVKDGAYNLLGEISNTSISDNNRYGYYKISSVINEIEGNLSNYITESPAAPINLSASFSPTDNVVKVSWNIVPTAESYKVYYSISPNDGEYSFLYFARDKFPQIINSTKLITLT